MKKICKNCALFNKQNNTCQVKIVYGPEVIRDVPVDPKNTCLWEQMGVADLIQEVRFWVEDPKTGEKTDGNGIVKMQYPEGFFGAPNHSI